MEIKFNNEEIEDIIREYLTRTLPTFTEGKKIHIDKYVGDVRIDVYEEKETADA